MPIVLADPPLWLYVVLALAAFATIGAWLRARKRLLLVTGVAILLLAAALFLIDRTNESPREQAIRSISQMADAVQKKDWNTFSSHVSDKFEAKGLTKKTLEGFFRIASDRYGLRAAAWDFELAEPLVYTDTEIDIRFDAKAEATGGQFAQQHFTAKFVLEGNRFRLVSFTMYNYVQKSQVEPFPTGVP